MMTRAIAVAVGVVVAAACKPGTTIDEHPCPQGSTLTYQNFGEEFFATWCVRCHGGAQGGYSSRSFTTVDSIRSQKDRVFANAAADNDAMPPGPDGPPPADRYKLADWLACGAP